MTKEPEVPEKKPKKEPPKPDKSHPPPQPKMRTREEILRDKCITDFCLKGASGLLVGGVFTLCFTRPQTFPLWLGMGIGMGIAYDCCNVRRSTMEYDHH